MALLCRVMMSLYWGKAKAKYIRYMHCYVLYVTEQRDIGRLFIESRYSYQRYIS